MPTTQVPPRDPDQTDAFEHAGSASTFHLIPAATVTASGLDSNAPRWNRVKDMTIRDLFHVLGFRKNDDVGTRIKNLQIDDVHAIGKCFQQHTGMSYPGKIFSCCTCW